MKIYIAGPITGMPNHNEQEFKSVENELRALGHEPVNPFTIADKLNTSYGEIQKSFDVLYKCGKDAPGSELAKKTIEMDMDELSTCDVIYLLPGWRKSRGSLEELRQAKKLGLDVVDSESI